MSNAEACIWEGRPGALGDQLRLHGPQLQLRSFVDRHQTHPTGGRARRNGGPCRFEGAAPAGQALPHSNCTGAVTQMLASAPEQRNVATISTDAVPLLASD